MIDPLFAAHIQQMRTHARRRRGKPVDTPRIPRRRLIALAVTALAATVGGLSVLNARRSPSL